MTKSHPAYILVIDDDPANNFLTQHALKKAQYKGQLDVFESALEALEMLDQLHDKNQALPDLIFLDINMPRMNGWEFLEASHARPWTSEMGKVAMLTASINPEDEQRAKTFRANHFLRKPLKSQDLEALFDSL